MVVRNKDSQMSIKSPALMWLWRRRYAGQLIHLTFWIRKIFGSPNGPYVPYLSYIHNGSSSSKVVYTRCKLGLFSNTSSRVALETADVESIQREAIEGMEGAALEKISAAHQSISLYKWIKNGPSRKRAPQAGGFCRVTAANIFYIYVNLKSYIHADYSLFLKQRQEYNFKRNCPNCSCWEI